MSPRNNACTNFNLFLSNPYFGRNIIFHVPNIFNLSLSPRLSLPLVWLGALLSGSKISLRVQLLNRLRGSVAIGILTRWPETTRLFFALIELNKYASTSNWIKYLFTFTAQRKLLNWISIINKRSSELNAKSWGINFFGKS